jgi:hypothetical protein
VWIGFFCPRIQHSGDLFWRWEWNFGFGKWRTRISRPDERLLDSQVGRSSMTFHHLITNDCNSTLSWTSSILFICSRCNVVRPVTYHPLIHASVTRPVSLYATK